MRPGFRHFRREGRPWDSLWYIFLGMPIICAVVAGLSYTDARRPWGWGLLPMMAQAVWMFATEGFGNLWPRVVVLFLVLTIPPIGTASLGALLGR